MILEQKLKFTIDTISTLVRNINLVAVNASISASHMEKYGDEGKAFKVIAKEIQDISNKSLGDITGLGDILGDVKFLSQTINTAGSLRMLSQKIMKLFLINNMSLNLNTASFTKEYNNMVTKFESVLSTIKECKLNTTDVNKAIEQASFEWYEFLNTLSNKSVEDSIEQNDKLLSSLQKVVSEYEKLAG